MNTPQSKRQPALRLHQPASRPTDLAKRNGSPFVSLEGVAFTTTSLTFTEDVGFDRWEAVGKTLRQINHAALWWIGDWLNYGERRYGETYSQALDEGDYEYQTLNAAAWVSRQIEFMRRRINLTWSHHREVAALPPSDQDELLARAEAEGWTTRDLRREVAKLKNCRLAGNEPEPAKGTYGVVVIDPPWPMEKIEREVRPNQVGFDYPTMEEYELAELDIPLAGNAHVWVWTTHKFLPMALRLLDRWGLNYVCTFTWHKPGGYQPVGLPQFNCEFALYARKGTPTFIDTKAFNVCFEAPRGRHSEKPEAFYELVRRVTKGRRLDMFNRRPIEGFDRWGNEANG
jgi:N6-adenosine-specific RNA methylase IME4